MKRNVLTAAQVAKRLGVKLQTVYAYVSRGLLTRTFAADGRTSQFDAGEVEALASRGRPRAERPRIFGVAVSLGTGITEIQSARLCYRGHDAVTLAREHGFETTCELLWGGALGEPPVWPELLAPEPVVRRAVQLLPRKSPAIERFATVAASLACMHPLRVDLSPERVLGHARLLLCSFVHALPVLGESTLPARRVKLARLLFPRLSPLPATTSRVLVLDEALALLADHELATSTFAVRVAASTRADPFAVVLAGLGALSGPLHGKAAIRLHRLLREAAREHDLESAVAQALQSDALARGFGHPVYAQGDPRARALLESLRPHTKPERLATIEAVHAEAVGRTSAAANVDFALAALAFAFEMPLGASEALFAIARTGGFIAHALEEYGEQPLRFRARAIYTGPS